MGHRRSCQDGAGGSVRDSCTWKDAQRTVPRRDGARLQPHHHTPGKHAVPEGQDKGFSCLSTSRLVHVQHHLLALSPGASSSQAGQPSPRVRELGWGQHTVARSPGAAQLQDFPGKKPIPKQLTCFPALGAHLLWVQVQLSSQVFAGAHGLGQPRGAEHPTADGSRATGKSQQVKKIPRRHPKSL